jgi:hypothetical protein
MSAGCDAVRCVEVLRDVFGGKPDGSPDFEEGDQPATQVTVQGSW